MNPEHSEINSSYSSLTDQQKERLKYNSDGEIIPPNLELYRQALKDLYKISPDHYHKIISLTEEYSRLSYFGEQAVKFFFFLVGIVFALVSILAIDGARDVVKELFDLEELNFLQHISTLGLGVTAGVVTEYCWFRIYQHFSKSEAKEIVLARLKETNLLFDNEPVDSAVSQILEIHEKALRKKRRRVRKSERLEKDSIKAEDVIGTISDKTLMSSGSQS